MPSSLNKNTQSCASPLTRYFACKWFILNHKWYNTEPNSVQQYISISGCAALCGSRSTFGWGKKKKKTNNIDAAGFLLLYSSHNEVEHVAPARRSALHVWPRIDFKTRFIHRSTASAQNYIFDLLICYEPAKPPTEKQHSSSELHIYETLTRLNQGLKFLLSLVLYLFKSQAFL